MPRIIDLIKQAAGRGPVELDAPQASETLPTSNLAVIINLVEQHVPEFMYSKLGDSYPSFLRDRSQGELFFYASLLAAVSIFGVILPIFDKIFRDREEKPATGDVDLKKANSTQWTEDDQTASVGGSEESEEEESHRERKESPAKEDSTSVSHVGAAEDEAAPIDMELNTPRSIGSPSSNLTASPVQTPELTTPDSIGDNVRDTKSSSGGTISGESPENDTIGDGVEQSPEVNVRGEVLSPVKEYSESLSFGSIPDGQDLTAEMENAAEDNSTKPTVDDNFPTNSTTANDSPKKSDVPDVNESADDTSNPPPESAPVLEPSTSTKIASPISKEGSKDNATKAGPTPKKSTSPTPPTSAPATPVAFPEQTLKKKTPRGSFMGLKSLSRLGGSTKKLSSTFKKRGSSSASVGSSK